MIQDDSRIEIRGLVVNIEYFFWGDEKKLMEKRFSIIYSQKWFQVVILIGFGLCLILFFFNLNRWNLWNPDEPSYAEVAREMVMEGNWILMHNNGGL